MNDDYEKTIEWLYGLEAKRGMDFRLARLLPVLARLGDPHLAFPTIHIAGTNGKGSTAAMLHSMYSGAGYRTALYTSPHLLSFRERIRVDSLRIEPAAVVGYVEEVRRVADHEGVALTFFEFATIVAFLEFRSRSVDLAIVEAGLGGRLDATNVVRPVAAVITSVGLDHAEFLGTTVEQVAAEKAAIVDPGCPLITGALPTEALAVVAERVAETGSGWMHLGRDFAVEDRTGCPLPGRHQLANAAVAEAVARVLGARFPVSDEAVRAGLAGTRWPGRLEIVARSPTIALDAAHNPQAVGCIVDSLPELGLAHPRVLVFGVMADKDWTAMLPPLLEACDHACLVPVNRPRGLDPRRLEPLAGEAFSHELCPSASAGLDRARRVAGIGGSVLVTGSIFLVAQLYEEAGGRPDPFREDELAA